LFIIIWLEQTVYISQQGHGVNEISSELTNVSSNRFVDI